MEIQGKNSLSFRYQFDLEDGSREICDLKLDLESIQLTGVEPANPPPWTRLEFHQCPHCPLTAGPNTHCPVSLNILPLVLPFEKLISYDRLTLTVTLPTRTVSGETTAQKALSSLLGLAIAASGCPHTDFLKPMARFHQPLADEEETVFRVTSSYMLVQYFRKKMGEEVDFSLTELKILYENLQILNSGIAQRLREASRTDSSINAVIQLDMYAKALPYIIDQSLEDLKYLFRPFLRH